MYQGSKHFNTCIPDGAKRRRATERLTVFLPSSMDSRSKNILYFNALANTPQISLIRYTLATSETTGMILIGLLSHMTPLKNGHLISFHCFGDDLLS